MQESEEDLLNLDDALKNVDIHISPNDRHLIDLIAIPDVDVPPSDLITIDDEAPAEISNDGLVRCRLLPKTSVWRWFWPCYQISPSSTHSN